MRLYLLEQRKLYSGDMLKVWSRVTVDVLPSCLFAAEAFCLFWRCSKMLLVKSKVWANDECDL